MGGPPPNRGKLSPASSRGRKSRPLILSTLLKLGAPCLLPSGERRGHRLARLRRKKPIALLDVNRLTDTTSGVSTLPRRQIWPTSANASRANAPRNSSAARAAHIPKTSLPPHPCGVASGFKLSHGLLSSSQGLARPSRRRLGPPPNRFQPQRGVYRSSCRGTLTCCSCKSESP